MRPRKAPVDVHLCIRRDTTVRNRGVAIREHVGKNPRRWKRMVLREARNNDGVRRDDREDEEPRWQAPLPSRPPPRHAGILAGAGRLERRAVILRRFDQHLEESVQSSSSMSRHSRLSAPVVAVVAALAAGGFAALACEHSGDVGAVDAAVPNASDDAPGFGWGPFDAVAPQQQPSCGCDAGGVVRLRVTAGDGDATAISLEHAQPFAVCSSDGPALSRVCGDLVLEACAEPDGGAPCIRLFPPRPPAPQSGDYVDEDGLAWNLVDASLDVHTDAGIVEGTLSAAALRVEGCDAGDCSRGITGDFEACALYESGLICD